jgi:hypothetical protein
MRNCFIALLGTVLIASIAIAAPTQINYNSLGGVSTNGGNIWFHNNGEISFGGDAHLSGSGGGATVAAPGFAGSPGTGFDFAVASCSGCVTNLNGLFGNIDDPAAGFFQMGAISTIGAVQTASVTGTGKISITDSSNHKFSGDLTWIDITSIGTQDGFNTNGSVNVTNLSYAGTNADLLALLNAKTGIATLTFTFTTAHNLTTLKGGNFTDAFTGTYAPAVPEPTFYALFGVGLAGAIWFNKRQKKNV